MHGKAIHTGKVDAQRDGDVAKQTVPGVSMATRSGGGVAKIAQIWDLGDSKEW